MPHTDTRDLLKHLVHIREDRSVEVAIAVGSKAGREAALGHLDDGVFDFSELRLNLGVILRQVAQGTQNSERFGFATLQDQPASNQSCLVPSDHLDAPTIEETPEDLGLRRR